MLEIGRRQNEEGDGMIAHLSALLDAAKDQLVKKTGDEMAARRQADADRASCRELEVKTDHARKEREAMFAKLDGAHKQAHEARRRHEECQKKLEDALSERMR